MSIPGWMESQVFKDLLNKVRTEAILPCVKAKVQQHLKLCKSENLLKLNHRTVFHCEVKLWFDKVLIKASLQNSKSKSCCPSKWRIRATNQSRCWRDFCICTAHKQRVNQVNSQWHFCSRHQGKIPQFFKLSLCFKRDLCDRGKMSR